MGFSLTYTLERAGWGTVRISDGSSSVHATVSYLHDSLRELAEAANGLQRGADRGRIVFMDEPGEVQLVFHRTDDALSYEVRSFADYNSWGMGPSESFDVDLSGTTTVRSFVAEVCGQMEDLLQKYGQDGYRKRWIEHEFPMDLLLQLRAGSKTEQATAPSVGPAASSASSAAGKAPPTVS